MNSTIHGRDGRVFRVERDYIDAQTMGGQVFDPDWKHVDKAGHIHWVVAGRYLTLEWMVTESWVDCDGDEQEEGHYECRACREEIEPGTKYEPPHTARMLGYVSYYIDEVPVSKIQFETELGTL